MTSLWRETRMLVTVTIIIGATAMIFPYRALTFRGMNHPKARSSAAYVLLSEEESEEALHAAKSAWQTEDAAQRRLRVRVPLGELPEEGELEALELESASAYSFSETKSVIYGKPAFRPSLAAERDSIELPKAPTAVKPAFSRDEMLQL